MKLTTRLFIPDTHAPFHDKKAFALMLEVAKEVRPDEVVVLGDFLIATRFRLTRRIRRSTSCSKRSSKKDDTCFD
jgi:hypothetical protein